MDELLKNQEYQSAPDWIKKRVQDFIKGDNNDLDLSRDYSELFHTFSGLGLSHLPDWLDLVLKNCSDQHVELNLSNQCLNTLPDWIGLYPNLSLNLAGNPMTQWPALFQGKLIIDSRQWLKPSAELQSFHISGFKLMPRDLDLIEGLPSLPFFNDLLSLDLSELSLKKVPGELPPNLTALDLSSNQLIYWPSTWPSSLQSLNLDLNNLSTSPDAWPSTLQSLSLNGNQLATWPDAWPSSLQSLSLHGNQLATWPDAWPSSLQRLSLNGNQLATWPDAWPSSLQNLNLGGNQLTTWPDGWPSSLQSLSLYGNQLTTWPDAWPSTLQSLSLNGNPLTTWPDGWPSSLQSLSLYGNQLTTWPDGWPSTLQSLNLGGNPLTTWPDGWPSSLQSLSLYGNQLTTWPDGWPSSLQSLNLGGNQLTTWPDAWPSSLQSLSLNRNSLTTWPDGWPSSLQSLDLYDNQLTTWPDGWPSSLQSLDLYDNQLTTWPDGWPSSLQSLNLGGNQLITWPDEWPSTLQSLYLYANQLTTWPDGWPSSLQSLHLYGNQLTTWPDEWPSLLQSLYLNGNPLTTWPDAWPSSLQTLDLYDNKLTTWPDEWPSSLQSLKLDGNQLTAWPDGWPSSLQSLSVNNNKLTTWPSSWPLSLTLLNLQDNQFSSVHKLILPYWLKLLEIDDNLLPDDVRAAAQSDLYAVEKLLSRQSSRTNIREAKLLIVGEPGAGKTSLMRKLKDANHIPKLQDEKGAESSTEGINIEAWEFSPAEKQLPFTANIWDFGGQEIQYATHRFFLTERAVYVIVADNRKQDTDFNYWFRIIKLLGQKDSQVVVFLHDKNDQMVDKYNESEYRIKYPEFNIKVKHANLRSSPADGFTQLKEVIQASLLKLPFVNETIDSAFMAVKEEVLQIRQDKHHLNYQQFTDICTSQQLAEAEVQSCLRYLNWMGVVIYFEHQSQLSNFIIIDPEWAVNPLYRVFGHKQVEENNGRFDRRFFHECLQAEALEYKPFEIDQLLTLVTRDHFEICFKMDLPQGDSETYVVPQLLPKAPEDLQVDKTLSGKPLSLVTEFHYDFLPKGIFSRLVVRNFQRIARDENDKLVVWRSGVIFKHENNLICVVEDKPSDKITGTIRIEVYGKERQGYSSLAIFRYELLRLNESLSKDLEGDVAEKIPCICYECEKSEKSYMHSVKKMYRFLNKENPKLTSECKYSGEDLDIGELAKHVLGAECIDSLSRNRELISMNPEESKSEILETDMLAKVIKLEVNLNNQVNQETNVSTQVVNKINIQLKNELCLDLAGDLDELKDFLRDQSNTDQKFIDEVNKNLDLIDKIEQGGEEDQSDAKRKLNRLKKFIGKLDEGMQRLGDGAEKIEKYKKITGKVVNGYNILCPMFGLLPIPNPFQSK